MNSDQGTVAVAYIGWWAEGRYPEVENPLPVRITVPGFIEPASAFLAGGNRETSMIFREHAGQMSDGRA